MYHFEYEEKITNVRRRATQHARPSPKLHYATLTALSVSNLSILGLAVLLSATTGNALGSIAGLEYSLQARAVEQTVAQAIAKAQTRTIVAGWTTLEGQNIKFIEGTQPTFADLYLDGRREIIAPVNNGVYMGYPDGSTKLFSFTTDQEERITHSIAVGDVTGDGKPNIIAVTAAGRVIIWDAEGAVYASFWVTDASTNITTSDPILANLDGDESDEIIIIANEKIIYVFKGNGTPVGQWPNTARQTVQKIVTDDIDGDGTTELLYLGRGGIRVWNGDGTAHTPSILPLSDAASYGL